jgi:predicted metal-dependent peptidase
MGRNECDEAIVQISAVLEEWPKTEITLVQCDVQIHESGTKEFTSADMPLRIPRNWHGRGGTNMQPAIDWLFARWWPLTATFRSGGAATQENEG